MSKKGNFNYLHVCITVKWRIELKCFLYKYYLNFANIVISRQLLKTKSKQDNFL